jgi:hypothetical protein
VCVRGEEEGQYVYRGDLFLYIVGLSFSSYHLVSFFLSPIYLLAPHLSGDDNDNKDGGRRGDALQKDQSFI